MGRLTDHWEEVDETWDAVYSLEDGHANVYACEMSDVNNRQRCQSETAVPGCYTASTTRELSHDRSGFTPPPFLRFSL
jgi:hypothetical protein